MSRSPFQSAQDTILEATKDDATLMTLRKLFPTRDGLSEECELSKLHEIVLGLSADDLGEVLASNSFSVDAPDSVGRTPLMWAVIRGDGVSVDRLLKAGASPNVQNLYGQTPLHRAAMSSSIACIKLLLDAGADVNLASKSQVTALSFAAFFLDNREMIEVLVAAGSDPNPGVNQESATPLWNAVSQNHTRTIEALIDCGSNIDFQDSDGDTALHHAIFFKSYDAMTLLLRRGADFTLLNHNNHHILHFTAEQGDSQTVRTLRKVNLHDIDTGLTAKDNRTAIQIAQERQDKPHDFVPLFKKLLADIDERNTAKAAQAPQPSSTPGKSGIVEDTRPSANRHQQLVSLRRLSNHISSHAWVKTSSNHLRECLNQSPWMGVLLSWIMGFGCAGLLYIALSNN